MYVKRGFVDVWLCYCSLLFRCPLLSPQPPFPTLCWRSPGSQGQVRKACPCALSVGQLGMEKLFARVVARQHLTSSQVTSRQSPAINGEEEPTDRPWEGPGLPDASPRVEKVEQPFCE